ncbi:MAG: carbohydrate binding family 9 domain-containing protein [Bacteroidetes bacterium]|nr:carbohydrate binding family 9 domain-containing protein [Bacteroidota bacterium]
MKVSSAPKLDGILDDAVWQNVPIAKDFIVNSPDFGKTPLMPTEVKFIYTDEAIYIGAELYDDPSLIKKQLTQRDREQFQDVDNFGVTFDTYYDQQNAFEFIVTTANVQSDAKISSSNNSSGGGNDDDFNDNGADYNWDAVWDSRVSITDKGWSVEMRIPYSAIRFAKKDLQQWGINFFRFTRRVNEKSYWNPVNPKIAGLLNQEGLLMGLANLSPPLRLSLLPFVSTGYQNVPTNQGDIKTFLRSGGMDVKYGINQAFTLDMTLIPDFGQVQSDNIVLNLSPYEKFYDENRPFFTEGTELFNKAGIFYSRRVGNTPSGYFDALNIAADSNYTILKNPSSTQLYNGTKFSGRTEKGLGIGIFNAVTAPMYATFQDVHGNKIQYQTEPLANYNIIVLDQSLKNRSSLTFTNTNVIRNGDARDANVTALNLSLFDKDNNYNFQTSGYFSYVNGPDPHNGFKTFTSFEKVSGNWQWGLYNNIESKTYDPNDLGILRAPNEFTMGGTLSWHQFTPSKMFNIRNYEFDIQYTNLLVPFTYNQLELDLSFMHVFKNFWDATLRINSHPLSDHDYYELRTPGRVLNVSPYTYFQIEGSSDSRKKIFVNYEFGYAGFSPQKNDPYISGDVGLRYRFNPKWSISIEGIKEYDKGNVGWAYNDSLTGEPIVGRRTVTQFTTSFSTIYYFQSRMNLSFRARHYWSKVEYLEFFDVLQDGNYLPRPFEDGHNENFNAFNIDMFFTWDFRLGSRLILAWKNSLGPDVYIPGQPYNKYTQNFREIFNVPHSNEFSVKFIYYIDAQNLFKKSNGAKNTAFSL